MMELRSADLLSRLSLNSLWLLISRLGTQIGLAFFTILLARGLGATVFGEYAFIASVVVVGNVLTTFGTDMLLIRDIAVMGDLTQLSPALTIQLILSALFIGIVFLGSQFLPIESLATTALRIYSLSLLPLAFYTVFTTALRGQQRMLAYSALNLALMVMQILSALWLLWRAGSLIQLAGLLLLVQILAAALAAWLCNRKSPEFRLAWRSSLQAVFPLLRKSAPIALLGVLGVIYQRFSLLLLPALAGAAATGWFSAGARLIEAAKIGHVAVFTALYPSMAQTLSANSTASPRAFRLPAMVLLLGACLAAVVINLLAGPIIRILFGTQYLSSIAVVQTLAWILVPYSVNSFLTLAFLARGEATALARALFVSIIALLVLTFWWTPLYGAAGAALAALSTETLQMLLLVSADFRLTKLIYSMLQHGEAGA